MRKKKAKRKKRTREESGDKKGEEEKKKKKKSKTKGGNRREIRKKREKKREESEGNQGESGGVRGNQGESGRIKGATRVMLVPACQTRWRSSVLPKCCTVPRSSLPGCPWPTAHARALPCAQSGLLVLPGRRRGSSFWKDRYCPTHCQQAPPWLPRPGGGRGVRKGGRNRGRIIIKKKRGEY